ncbi:MAG TPA: hypothetical protein VKD90_06020 [Gemmataceae bacterium]|nr:hypothetical protein [Gemmataceae bacterium]
MPSRVKCPQCENAYAYSPALLGKTVRCRQCQHQFTITAPPPEESPAPAPGPSAPAASAPTAGPPSARTSAPGSKPAPPPLPPTASTKAAKPGDTSSRPGVAGGKGTEKGGKSAGSRRRDEDDEDDRPQIGDRQWDDDRPSRRRADDEDGDRPRSRHRDADDRDDGEDRRDRGRSDRSGRRPGPAPERESSPLLLIGLIAAFVIGFLIIAAGIGYLLWPSSTPASSQAPVGPVVASDPMTAADPPKALDEIIKDAPNRKEVEAGPRPPDRPNFDAPKFDAAPRAKRGPKAGGPAPAGVPPPPDVDLPPFEPPAFPGGPPGRPRPNLPAPKLAPLDPLPIAPTPMAADRVEQTMPGPIENMIVAGGGRLLLLHLPGPRCVAVVDVNKWERVKLIPAEDPGARVAGGMNVFVIYLPAKGILERWNCRTLERDAELKADFGVEVKALAMGSASNGPLVAALGGGRRTVQGATTLGYFDPMTGKELGYEIGGAKNPFGIGISDANPLVRVSADGSVVTAWGDNGRGGAQSDVIEGGRITRHWQSRWLGAAVPGPDGRTVYGRGERFPPDLKGGRIPRDDPRNPVWLIPAVHGDYFVSLRGSAADAGKLGRPRKAVAEICLGADAKSVLNLGELVDFELPTGIGDARGKTFDQYVALVPDAKLFAFVPTKARERLVLRRADVATAPKVK